MKIELNGKALLAVGLLSAGLAFGEYVSVISSNDVSYTSGNLGTPIGDIMTVGTVVMRMDDKNPSEVFGGTWELITGDAALYFGNGSNLTGQIVDSNYMENVPLPKHTHTATVSNYTHSHTYTNPSYSYAGIIAGNQSRRFGDTGAEQLHNYGTSPDTHNHTVTLTQEGVDNPQIDVRDARIHINVWKRVL
jgi:hypothetical protein